MNISITDLPLELIEIIASHLDYDDMVNFLSCNESWWKIGSQMLKYAKPVMYEDVKDKTDFHKYTHLVYRGPYIPGIKCKVKTYIHYTTWPDEIPCCSPKMWPNLYYLKIYGSMEDVVIPRHVQRLYVIDNRANLIVIPRHIKHAKISSIKARIALPEGLISLDASRSKLATIDKFPSTLTKLILPFHCSFGKWPSELKYLDLRGFNNITNLPPNLTHLCMDIKSADFYSLKDELPTDLQYLKLTGIDNISLSDLPQNLITLVIDVYNYNQNLRGILPQTLQYLEIRSNKYDISSLGYLPAGLKTLKIDGEIIHKFKRQKYVNDMVCYRIEQIIYIIINALIAYLLIRMIDR